MATLNFSFETGNVPIPRIVSGVARHYGWTETVPDPNSQIGGTIPNPITMQDYARQAVKHILIDAVKATEIEDARIAAIEAIDPITLT